MAKAKIISVENITPLRDAFMEFNSAYTNLGADYSVTDLIKPPRVTQLFRRHKAEIDAMPWDWYTSLKAFKGSAIHDRLETYLYRHMSKNPESGYLIEKRLWDRILDRKISGKFDVYRQGILYDWKTCSAWKRMFESYEDWIEQLNMYAYLLSTVNVEVKAICIVAWYMDWDKFKVFDKGYPKSEVEGIHLTELWTPKVQKDHLYARIQAHKDAETVAEDQLPECSAKDRWDKAEAYAVTHPDSKKALRVLPTEAKCKAWIQTYSKRAKKTYKPDTMVLEHRPGKRMRCEDFCKANVFCNQWQAFKASQKKAGA